ncbi:hypothetical protein GNE08_09515 [Trichormus variabilis ARAD]|uniref:Uncharacterized protein n=1 Tax=Trichormus variabilis N2B TaxID=2681315 RepID=A0ABR6S228_ANAVA|nr:MULTISPECIES: hypothetical protein [Nostocaceae]MBC1214459.1 hypothetical protein [Trichormus variabilis ARAD]MBC1256498.1 hypothetical protein [Trichormus variabilis V5]MBC1269953.1 hypothetical protein [Trichormus variabilis FSR]MBC1300433.1 hypothetical protein [Trichormus variabilis N2B]MBC1312585.1 hypothetical protein [Trichormus variabilis PNB]
MIANFRSDANANEALPVGWLELSEIQQIIYFFKKKLYVKLPAWNQDNLVLGYGANINSLCCKYTSLRLHPTYS